MNYIGSNSSKLPETLHNTHVSTVLNYDMSTIALRQLEGKGLSRSESIILCLTRSSIEYIWKNLSLTKEEKIYIIQASCYRGLYELIRTLLTEKSLSLNNIRQLMKQNPQYAYYIGYNYIDKLSKKDKRLMLYSLLWSKTVTNEFRNEKKV